MDREALAGQSCEHFCHRGADALISASVITGASSAATRARAVSRSSEHTAVVVGSGRAAVAAAHHQQRGGERSRIDAADRGPGPSAMTASGIVSPRLAVADPHRTHACDDDGSCRRAVRRRVGGQAPGTSRAGDSISANAPAGRAQSSPITPAKTSANHRRSGPPEVPADHSIGGSASGSPGANSQRRPGACAEPPVAGRPWP